MNITVYLGANEGNDPALHKAVTELGAWIGQSGNTLVYGGSKSGLMGALADSVLNAGGRAIGVEPQFFVEKELQHDGLTQLIVTKDMSERKNKMIELGDAFIAFPGGTGTLEEITDILHHAVMREKVKVLKNQPVVTFQLFQFARCFIDRLTVLTVSGTLPKIRKLSIIDLFKHGRTAKQR